MLGKLKYDVRQWVKEKIGYNRLQDQLRDLEQKVLYNHFMRLEKRFDKLEKNEKGNSYPDYPSLPTLSNPVSQAATFNQFGEEEYSYWCKELKTVPRYHRKQWEFVYILQVLNKYDLLKKGMKGLGFGVGKEPVPDLLAGRDVEVLCTDLSPEKQVAGAWIESNQHSIKKKDLRFRYISSAFQFKKNVSFSFVDMNDIPDDLEGFDFTWSACACEHLGSIENGISFIKNSLRCLNPGGVAVHTTEFNVSSDDDTVIEGSTVLFRKKDMEAMADELRKEGHSIELNFNTGAQPLDSFYDIPPYSENIHLKLLIEKYITTSFGVVVKKAE